MLIAKGTTEASAETFARLIPGLLGGIGFIGGGAILKHGTNVSGSGNGFKHRRIGAIGAAVAFEREEIAVVLSLITFVTLRLLTPVSENSGDDNEDVLDDESSKKQEKTHHPFSSFKC